MPRALLERIYVARYSSEMLVIHSGMLKCSAPKGADRSRVCCLTEGAESKFHVGLRVRRAAVGGVGATAVDVADIIKMAVNFKTVVLEEKTTLVGRRD